MIISIYLNALRLAKAPACPSQSWKPGVQLSGSAAVSSASGLRAAAAASW